MKRQDHYDYTDVSPYREVSLLALARRVLRAWRILLIAGLAGALLLGGLQVVRYRGRRDSINEKRAVYEQNMASYESARVSYQEEIDQLEDTINRRQTYVKESALMQIDPQNAGLGEVVYTIRVPELTNAEDTDDTSGVRRMNDIVRAICLYVKDGGMADGNTSELVTASYEESPRQISTSATNQTSINMSDQVTGVITLKVRAKDQENAQRLLELFADGVEDYAAALQVTAGEFELVELSRQLRTGVDNELMTYQNLKYAEIYTLQNNLSNKQKFLTALAKPAYADTYSTGTLLKTGIKYAVAGWVAADAVLVLALALWILLSGRILTAAEIDRKYGFKNLITFADNEKGLMIDRYLSRPAEADPSLTTAQACDLLYSRIRNIAVGSGRGPATGQVILVGNVADKKLRGLMKAMADRASGRGDKLMFRCLADPTHHPETLHSIGESGGVVLVGEIGDTTYREMMQLVDLVDDTGRPVLGTVYF